MLAFTGRNIFNSITNQRSPSKILKQYLNPSGETVPLSKKKNLRKNKKKIHQNCSGQIL
jgi:hypothetical protein